MFLMMNLCVIIALHFIQLFAYESHIPNGLNALPDAPFTATTFRVRFNNDPLMMIR
jgi:hypothetical protein